MGMIRRRNTIVTDIAGELRTRILSGQLQPGQYLEPQKILAEQFGVGLSTVREAIQYLAAVGMVESHPGKGTWVSQGALTAVFNPTEVKTRLGELNAQQLYEARSVIEVGLTCYAAERASPEEIAHIWQAIHAMGESMKDDQAYVNADVDFHLSVARAGHNSMLEQFYFLVRELFSEVVTQFVMLPKVKTESIILQTAIAQAIETHNLEQARQAAQTHMQYIESLLQIYG